MSTLAQSITQKHLAKPGVPKFQSGQLELELEAIRAKSHDVKTFCFKVCHFQHGQFKFHPGQAVSLRINLNDEEVVRTFTIASSPTQLPKIELTIKAAESGHATRYLHQELKVGEKLQATGPFGEFSLVHTPNQPLLLIGAGSGMTPMMSMLRWLSQREEQVDVILLQQAKTPKDLLFSEELAAIDANMPNLTVINSVSNVPAGQSWSSVRGRPTRKLITTLVPDLSQRTVFCCGPSGFNALMLAIYKAEGGNANGDETRFHTETFSSSDADIQIDKSKLAEHKNDELGDNEFSVDIDGYRFTTASEQNLVASAAESGIRIPTSCKEGNCGTCKVKLVSGEVAMKPCSGLSRKEQDAGYILACSTSAKSNLVISRKGNK